MCAVQLALALLLGQCGPQGCPLPGANVGGLWPRSVLELEAIPSDAEVCIDGQAIQLVDGKARLRTIPLEPGWRYQYTVTARWADVERAWTLSFSPGQTVRVVLRRDEAAPSSSGSHSPSGPSAAPSASTKPAQPPPSSPPRPPAPAPGTASGATPSRHPGAASKPEGQLPVVE